MNSCNCNLMMRAMIAGTHTVIRRNPKEKGKVKLIIGNWSGHEPCTNGWVGTGMLDMDIVGDIFAAPSFETMFQSLKLIDDGSPILLLVQNHAGDVLNANICYQMAMSAGMDIHKVLFYDDIASAPLASQEERRGMAGYIFYMKIVGAMAEGGVNSVPMCSAKELAEKICDIMIEDGQFKQGDELITLVNGTGATTVMELNIIYKNMFEYLTGKGMNPSHAIIDNLLTTQESAGFSISMLKITSSMYPYWQAPSNAPYFKQ